MAGQKASAANYFDCVTIYTCYWQALCPDESGNTITYGTITQSTDSCTEPGYEACGIMVWSIGWNDLGFDTYEQCVQVDDPPMPEPTDPGNPGGGGNEGPQNVQTLDLSTLTPCEVKVMKELQAASGTALFSILTMYSSGVPGYNWKVTNGSLPVGTYGSTSPYNRANQTVTTTFDADKWADASDLSVARTMLHEEVHAFLNCYFANDPIGANATYTDLVNAWTTAALNKPDLNIFHHNEMAQSWVGDVAWSLKQYGISKGYTLSDQFYTDMAWGGLEDTQLFQALPAADKARIHNTLVTEITGKDAQGNSATQSGQKTGC